MAFDARSGKPSGARLLVAGALLGASGSQAAGHVGLSGVLFGATVLAAATSLPFFVLR